MSYKLIQKSPVADIIIGFVLKNTKMRIKRVKIEFADSSKVIKLYFL